MRKVSFGAAENYILARYRMAEEDVQRQYDPRWSWDYADQFHSVYIFRPNLYGKLEEDGDQGSGLYLFRPDDWLFSNAVYIDTKKPGWTLHLQKVLKQLDSRARKNPSSQDAALWNLCQQRQEDVERAIGSRLSLTWDIGPYAHFNTPRGFGVTFHSHSNPNWGDCHIRLSKKLLTAPASRQDGIIRHELGHVVDLSFGRGSVDRWAARRGVKLPSPQQGELRADVIAHAVWGKPLLYDADTVQNTVVGVPVRPAYLGY